MTSEEQEGDGKRSMENGSIAWEGHAMEAVPRKKVLAVKEEPRVQLRNKDAKIFE